MATGYASNEYKIRGIQQQPYVLEKVLRFLKSKGYIVHAIRATFIEDTEAKIDYFLVFDQSTPFLGKLIVPIDVKYGKTYTMISHNQTNVLEKSKATYVVINHPARPNKLLWVSINKLKQCVKSYAPELHNSKEPENKSKYILIFDYVETHKNFFGKASMEVEVL